MSEKIVSRREDAVGRVVFNNPEKRNAVSLEMWQAAEAALDEFAADEGVRVVVLSGAGEQGVRLGRRHLEVRERARGRGGGRALQRDDRALLSEAHGLPRSR